MIYEENEKQEYFKGDTVIIPIEFSNDSSLGVADFNDIDKLEIVVGSLLPYKFTFTTDSDAAVDLDHLITIDNPLQFYFVIPSADTELMLGNITLKVSYYLTYNGKSLKQTDFINTTLKIIE